ncbi:UNVERIFIED_CONTAM: hypothetical protein GTU68_025374, partial [Idotea baltica]|nr:hypothetical protein [Idotea baltica]
MNALVGERLAIITNKAQTTRHRIIGIVNEADYQIVYSDTPGILDPEYKLQESMMRFVKSTVQQVQIAIQEASLIIFMTDVTTGITDIDDQVTRMLRKTDKPVLLTVNKVDNGRRELEANEFYALGIEETYFLSSITGSGTGELLDALTAHIGDDVEEEKEDIPKIAIIGQPNVGKSSMLNALVGEQRNIVTNIAGTTRDSIHTRYNLFSKEFLLIDTAGIRKKAKVSENLEFYSVIRAIKAIDEADVCMMMLDAEMGIEAQDLSIFRLVQNKNKGVVFLVNKWDLIDK